MPQCIFCKSESNRFSTREHILPESLGGGDWAVLKDGLLCDICQNKFGSDVEQKALGDYPFSFFRVFLGVPTKKRKAPWFDSWEGELRAGGMPGTLDYKAAPPFVEATKRREKTVMRIVAESTRPKMICRLLLKMAIEVIANHNSSDVFHERYNPARKFALTGRKRGDWWYLLREDMQAGQKYFTRGASIRVHTFTPLSDVSRACWRDFAQLEYSVLRHAKFSSVALDFVLTQWQSIASASVAPASTT